ncbi:uncharacterized protein M421DRAFT_333629 [Didymella exigua CBS 183.55]|uniref:Secreted protein n=1 Tax=Didymella exigua CBS 183.55 TaxID=1150837 RepID=A0A6A5R5X7_9PLEO|nr:uncharacterized protein M421DRAFT_333629 [Didymella exigua CBS 183.55]KAF1923003.1 hypothetical protein M421DRAFT_333629 [Didymella exigua CBS 183.55]
MMIAWRSLTIALIHVMTSGQRIKLCSQQGRLTFWTLQPRQPPSLVQNSSRASSSTAPEGSMRSLPTSSEQFHPPAVHIGQTPSSCTSYPQERYRGCLRPQCMPLQPAGRPTRASISKKTSKKTSKKRSNSSAFSRAW